MPADLPWSEHLSVATSPPDNGDVGTERFNFDVARDLTPPLHRYGRISIRRSPRPRLARPTPGTDGVAIDDLEDPTATEHFGMSAYKLRNSEEFAAEKAERWGADENWDSKAPAPDPPDANAPAGPPPSDERSRQARPLRGPIGVGLVIVGGPAGGLQFTADEHTAVVAQVQHGLSWLGGVPGGAAVTWTYDINPVDLDVDVDASALGFEDRERVFRDGALAVLGHGPGMSGVEDYLTELTGRLAVTTAFAAFVTKYPVGHFAYAAMGGPRIVQDYANGLWGPTNIDRVFAHETCHIFGSPDEYAGSGCDCGGAWGASGGPNLNCEGCAAEPTLCIMRNNVWQMCAATRGHVGW